MTANVKLRDQNDKNQIYKTKITIENFKVVICILPTIIISLDKILSLYWNVTHETHENQMDKKKTTTTTHDDQMFHACSFIGLFFAGEYFNKVSLLDNS